MFTWNESKQAVIQAHPGWMHVECDPDASEIFETPVVAWLLAEDDGALVPVTIHGVCVGLFGDDYFIRRPDGKYETGDLTPAEEEHDVLEHFAKALKRIEARRAK